MAWKKRKNRVLDGEVIEPSPWRITQNELASEVNGFLDNDNMTNHHLESKHVKRDTFTKVLINHRFSQHAYIFSHEQGGWTNVADWLGIENNDTKWFGIGSNNMRTEIAERSFGYIGDEDSAGSVPTLRSEAGGRLATIEEAGYGVVSAGYPLIKHRHQESTTGSGAFNEWDQPYGFDATTRLPFYRFNAEVDSMLIAELSATFSWLPHLGSLYDYSRYYKNAWYHRRVDLDEASEWSGDKKYFYWFGGNSYHYASPDGKRRNTDVWILCSQMRITVDGDSIAQTRWLGPELEHHPVYLTGATPIAAGEHVVQAEVRFAWVNPVKGSSRSSSSGAYKLDWRPDLPDNIAWLRIDCSVRFPNLIAQIRSR